MHFPKAKTLYSTTAFYFRKCDGKTQPLEVMLGDQVSHVVFNTIECPANPMVLGLPWFELHNPDVDWSLQRISSK
jgi:hypothetical protein